MSIATVLQHVPAWVYALLLGLIALGLSQAVPRRMTLKRSLVMPLALSAVSLAGVVSGFGSQAAALPAWLAGLGLALAALHGRVDLSAVRYSAAERTFSLPGSWVPLALMMGLFALKFVAGALQARQPALAGTATFAVLASLTYGVFSGVFLGRAVALWGLVRTGEPAALSA